MALPYPIPDPAFGVWDAFALKRNLEYLDTRFNNPASLSQFVSTVYARSTGNPLITLENTTTETTLSSATIIGGTLSTDRTLRFTIKGDVLNNTGVDRSFTLRIKYGGTTVMTLTCTAPSNATRRGWFMDATLTNNGVANSQYTGGRITFFQPGITGTAVDIGDSSFSAYSQSAVDSTLSQAFLFTGQLSTNSTDLSVRVFPATVELL